MKNAILVLVTLGLLVGCNQRAENPATAAITEKDAAPFYKEGEGIHLCDATKDSLTLKTAAVAERKEGGEAILVVPKSAVLNTTAGAIVFVENGAHYKRANVKVGRTFGDSVEITDGVYEGDNIVTDATQTLWLIELRAVKGGKGCGCAMPEKKKA